MNCPSFLNGLLTFFKGFFYYLFLNSNESALNFKRESNSFSFSSIRPHIYDSTNCTGFSKHYIYHINWAIRKIHAIKPTTVCDFGSSLYYITSITSLCKVVFFDIRPPNLLLDHLYTHKCDIVDVSHIPFESFSFISCLHVLEHIGIGRYGDPLNKNGDLIASKNITNLLQHNGDLLIVVPIASKARLSYNANRIYSFEEVTNQLFPSLELISFSLITDEDFSGIPFTEDTLSSLQLLPSQNHACGCFHFKKLQ